MHYAQANSELLTKMQQDHTLALANITTATEAGRTSVALLTKTISELSGQVALLTANSPQRRSRTHCWRNQDSNQPQLGMCIESPETRPCRSLTQVKITTYILEADRYLTQMGAAHPIYTRWRSRTSQQHAFFQVMVTTSELRD